ncbi:hypothetical protein [uncultured Novosphingobium sp.]|uniref:hypothetical protein n=1 Tax=uncultured Novosphingobium sp. TaxID=292277 RepID=UPI0037493DDA
MPDETATPTVGYKDQFHLHDGTALYRLRGLKEFDMPVGGEREQIEVTDFDAEDWRRQYISGFYEDSDFELLLNARPLSTTDVLLTDARDQGDTRNFMAVITIDGEPVAQITGTAKCTGYTYGRIVVGGLKEATATFRVVSVNSLEAYTAPTPTP